MVSQARKSKVCPDGPDDGVDVVIGRTTMEHPIEIYGQDPRRTQSKTRRLTRSEAE